MRWGDIDVLRRTVTISRKVIEVSGAGMVEGPTKTKAGHRTVTLPRRVLIELEDHRTAYGSTGLMVTSEEGAQVRVNNLRRRQWAAAVRRAGLDGLTFHDMRHGGVTLGGRGRVGPRGRNVGRPPFGGLHQEPLRPPVPEHGQALADRLDAFIVASTATPAAAVVPIRPF